jgi:hypothetical protein
LRTKWNLRAKHQEHYGMKKFLEPLLLAMVAAVCWQASISHFLPGRPFFFQTASAQVLQLFALSFVGLVLTSFWLAAKDRSLFAVVRDEVSAEIHAARERRGIYRLRDSSGWLFALILVMGFALRLVFLWQPMEYDEADTVLRFVHGPLANAFYYPLPNNHVLNSLLEKAVCSITGPTPFGARLPDFITGLLLIAATFQASRQLNQGSGGYVAMLVVAICPMMVLFATTGRGYSLLALLVVLMVRVSLAADGRQVSGRWGLAALLGAMGMWVMPSMLFALASVAAWVAACMLLQGDGWRRVIGYLCGYFGLSILLTLLLYVPVALASEGFGSVVANRYVVSLPFVQFANEAAPHIWETARAFTRDVPLVVVLLIALACIVGCLMPLDERRYPSKLLLPMFVMGSGVLFVAKHSIPFPRTWVYFIPIVAIAADSGVAALAPRFALRWQKLTIGMALLTGAAISVHVGISGAVSNYPDIGTFAQAKQVSTFLARSINQHDVVCAQAPADVPTAYYLWREVPSDAYASRTGDAHTYVLQLNESEQALPHDDNAKLLLSGPGYQLYQWSRVVQMIPSATCWSPYAQSLR